MTTFLEPDDRIAILAHDHFPSDAKTALGLLRYGEYEVAGILDSARHGEEVADHIAGVQDAPIVETFEEVPGHVDALVIGIAPTGGALDPSWRDDISAALRSGCDIVSGLHVLLAEDEEFAALARRHDASIHDVREPPDDLGVAQAKAEDVNADIVLTVGTDASVGKMTTSMELVRAARERGVDAGFIPTGQTGIMIAGWGIAIDRVIADFAAGAVERMILEIGDDHDLLIVEGQGSLSHPGFSADSIALLHGAMPDRCVLVHEAGREILTSYENVPLYDPTAQLELYEAAAAPVRETEVVAGSLNTSRLDNADAERAVDAYAERLGVPATDVLRFGVDPIFDAVNGQ